MPAKLIVNPRAGSEAALDHLPTINERLRERFDRLDIVLTAPDGDAIEAGRQAVEDGYEHIIVGGGDGTLNEVLNGVAQAPGGLARVTFGILPLGTGNDFAEALGVPDDIEAALDVLLEGTPVAVDVGQLNDARVFVNVSAGGFIAAVSDAVSQPLKSLTGSLAYLIGGAQVLLEYEPVRARVQIGGPDAAPKETALYAFAVCNAPLIGGGRLIAPHAVVDDGQLDVCLIHAMPTLEFVALLRRVSAGEHVEDDRVTYCRTGTLALTFDQRIKVNTDGQVLEADRCRYRILPTAARFLRGATRRDAPQIRPVDA